MMKSMLLAAHGRRARVEAERERDEGTRAEVDHRLGTVSLSEERRGVCRTTASSRHLSVDK